MTIEEAVEAEREGFTVGHLEHGTLGIITDVSLIDGTARFYLTNGEASWVPVGDLVLVP